MIENCGGEGHQDTQEMLVVFTLFTPRKVPEPVLTLLSGYNVPLKITINY